MSVWSNPCYAVEPLRNAVNNLPSTSWMEFPEELSGIANFSFGDCSRRHPERANQRASDFYRANPKEWYDFCASGKANLTGIEAIQFRNTLRQTHCEYAGIRAVYWAFGKFREGDWKAKETIDAEELVCFTGKAHQLAAAASRINQETWDEATEYYQTGATDEGGWATREALADAVRYLWTYKTSQKIRRIGTKAKVLIEKVASTRFKTAKTSDDLAQMMAKESSMVRVPPSRRFDADAAKLAYGAVMKNLATGQPVSKSDALAISLLPYMEMPVKGGNCVLFGFKGGMIVYDKLSRESGFFLEKDWDRLVQMLQADAKLTLYYSKYECGERALSAIMIKKYEAIMGEFIRSLDASSDYKCNRYCRAYDVYQFVYLASLADDVTDRSSADQLAKVKKEQLNEIVNMRNYLSIIDDERLGVKESLELLKFNKIFPCPDFCTYSVCDDLEKKADQTHPCEDRALLFADGAVEVYADVEELRMYMKRSRLLNFYEVHGFLPGALADVEDIPDHIRAYPDVPPKNILISDMVFIDFDGTFKYRAYDGCENELVKDKVIAPTIRTGDTRPLNEIPKVERNQVLKYLFSESFLSQGDVFKMAADGVLFNTWKNWILLALKPEAKKPGSRAFSMAMDEYRRLLSEFESNVSVYTSSQKGSSIGKSTKDLDERLGTMTETPGLSLSYNAVTQAVMFSFDLEGFSPMQNPRFKQMGIESWANAFGKPELYATLGIFTGVELTFDKFGVRDVFESRGNDLEGFQGKMNTSIHIDLMGYAVSKLKEAGVAFGPAQLEVLIDDGLLRVELSTTPGTIDIAMDIIDRVYKFAGHSISWDKTFVSRVMAQYLNRVFYDGVEVTPGAKAFMRIGKKQECAVPTLNDELMSHASAARGAIQNGSHHFLAYYAYMVECYKSLRIWGMKDPSEANMQRMAFALFIPVGLGGFGASTLYGLSTNESFNALQSGIAAMKMICHTFKGYAPMANTYLNAGVRAMDAESILRNPCAIRSKLRCMNLRRFANAARAYVLEHSKNTLIVKANLGMFDDIEQAVVSEVEASDEVSEVKRKLMWDMTFKSYLDSIIGKLQNSQTAATILGTKKCIRILIQNRVETRKLIEETLTGKLVYRVF